MPCSSTKRSQDDWRAERRGENRKGDQRYTGVSGLEEQVKWRVERDLYKVRTSVERLWSEAAQSCATLCNPMDCNLPGSSIHGIFQARVLEWVAISFSRGSSWPRDRTWVSQTLYLLSHQGSPPLDSTLLVPGTIVMEDDFPTAWGSGGEWLWDDASTLHLLCTLFLLLYQLHLRPSRH